MKKKRRIENRIIAVILCMAILFSQVNIADAADINPSGTNTSQVTLSDDANKSNGEVSTESTVSDEINGTTESESKISEETSENSKNDESESSGGNVKSESTDNIDAYYKDSKICIYNYEQLKQIGSDAYIYTGDKDGQIGSGEVVKSEGTELKYGADAQYILMNDIQLNSEQMWLVPDSFTGTITGTKLEENETPTLYDKETDTIYIYNPYQLMVLAQEESETEPVMSMDYDAPQFGMGQMIYPDGEDQEYLTYSKTHKYVISEKFSSDKPELLADQVTTVSDTEGRDFKGQVVKTIGDKTYILIGNEEQLREIGSKATVYGAVYQAYEDAALKWHLDTDSDGNPIMLYGGDADLSSSQNGNKDYSLGAISDTEASLGTHKANIHGKCGVNQATGKIEPNLDIDKASGQTYSPTANYIIFRDIDLSSANWTPLMFSGNMIGAKANGQSTLWQNDASVTDYSKATELSTNVNRPVISNITVNQTGKMDGTKYIGIGFFATVTNEVNVADIGVSAGTVTVSNIELNNVSVQNNSNTHKNTQTLISGLTSSLGWLVGGLVDVLVGALTFGQVKLNLHDTLSALLNARAEDPTIYATGAFAGRIVGDVAIENCDVTGTVQVSNINDRTGGFVGYTEGVTQYSGLSKVLGVTVDALSSLLNAIPGLGLGDLITILLKKALPVSDLIPTGYKNVNIRNCSVEGLAGTIGQNDKSYIGGFVGQQVGTDIQNCSVKNSTYAITSKEYGGGFSGICRDADIQGTLSDVGIELVRVTQPQSLLLNCNLTDSNVTVEGENYQGGITGAQTNSYVINCGATGSISVKASGNYAGGVTGIATVGWVTNLGKDEVANTSLLKTVGDLLTKLLSSNPDQAGMLLSLAGIAPSAILGCNMNCQMISVEAGKSYAGGILGGGDGVYLAESSADYLNKLSYWKYGVLDTGNVSQRENMLNGLESVKAGEHRVGGVAGSVTTASVTGLLNNTLGVGSFLGFTVHSVTVTGVDAGYAVTATGNYAGGALGEAIGGDVQSVTLHQLKSVTAKNRCGGFVGCAGPGDLAGANGLTVNLLGLNHLLNVSNLLSVAEGIRVKITDAHVDGITGGFTVQAKGSNADGESVDYVAGGFIGKSNSCEISQSDVKNLKEVTANDTDGNAGGFIGTSSTGGLADVADETEIKALISANGLLNAVKYLIPSYTQCTVSYVSGGGVTADTAGGFAGSFQSGTVNNQAAGEGNYYSVYNLDHVNGQSYAGGFGGNVYSGALAQAGKGISILGSINGLNINIGDLVNLINAYIPYVQYAGIQSKEGFTVTANTIKAADSNSGSAGGFIGYGSGVQVSTCDVSNLKHTTVTTPKNLEDTDGSSYFNTKQSAYAVTGARYAGGYIGYMDIGSAASVGKGLSVLGTAIGINDVLDALNVVVSTVEHSNVTGNTGGFAVIASTKNTESDASADDVLGDAGGFAGKISGGHIQDSNSYNFSYVIGQITSGGYVGDLEPGNVASVLGDASILKGLVSVKDSLASVAQDFVPTIRNSSTTCIPCGGAVRAEAESTKSVQRGLAGGYAGHNEGGHIWGNNTKNWKGNKYTGPTSTCEAVRIRSVYGAEIAGGFTGLMEAADTASAGNLSLLWGLVKADNILGALSIVYPTEENTAVYGPLAKMDYKTWNSWVEHVGKYGGYGSDLAKNGTVENQEALDAILSKYAYGYQVVAGRSQYRDETTLANGGAAGGYVGSMKTGTITNGNAYQTKAVKGLRCAGGFAGEMVNGGAANLGGVNILGLKLELGQMLNVLDVFVPVIKQSSVEGYQSGLSVQSNGTDTRKTCGYAGGYIGRMIGGQIWGADTATVCQVSKLRRVDGTSYVGGFVGSSKPGSVASVNTTAGEDLLSKLLNSLISAPADLIKVLDATVSTIRYADVNAWDDWGIIVNGAYADGSKNTAYATAAGGFAGSLSGTVLGKKDTEGSGPVVNGIRSVVAGEYAGGCFGIADVDAGVSVSADGETSVLGYLLKLGQLDVLDAFRTYVYYGSVSGSNDDGLSVSALKAVKSGQNNQVTYSGNAGGFGGALLNSTVKNSTVVALSNVTGPNSVGGFIGYSGKSGVVDVNKLNVLGDNMGQLLGGALGVLDVFGSHIDDSMVTGIDGGYTVQSTGGEEQIAGGFIGYANLARMAGCNAGDQKEQTHGLKQVASGGTAGGFAGRTSFAYLADVKLDSTVVKAVVTILNQLVKALYLDKIQESDLLNINLGIIKVQALCEGNLLHVNLLGLDISVALVKQSAENKQETDFAVITIGDSTIKLPCNSDGIIDKDNDLESTISINLIKANRTKITDSNVYGISTGYDVYAGGAGNDADGTAEDGRSGGFVGFNDEGLLQDNNMYYCDVVRGTKDLVGPFSGKSNLNSVYSFNTKKNVEGENNIYRIYRKLDGTLDEIKKSSHILNSKYEKDDASGWNIYSIEHMQTVESYDTLKDAELASAQGTKTANLDAYVSAAKAVLMADTKTSFNTGESDTPEPSESQDPCDEFVNLTINKVWKDLNNFSDLRPDNIKVTISRTWTDSNQQEQTKIVPGYESYTINGSEKKSTWQEVIKGLPAYQTDEDGTIHYYTYSVTETEVTGYTTTVNTSDDGFTFNITNRHFPGLPDTGGYGSYLIYLIGILLLLVYLAMRYKKSKENQKAEQL
ncbi:Cna B-type domain-containing protein [Ruminococcus hominis]|uniref:Cna B-type domain-containing protein n=1 Tax=Ruminococcus hominis TaxID=2763065 RepID=A0ABR7G4H0_9FIRM|nr:Cna B-type domain-containing protein [Ruminococcus hominis]MBC5682327.1 Cna B-type domain-containing protein [Ruminococcus hominis]